MQMMSKHFHFDLDALIFSSNLLEDQPLDSKERLRLRKKQESGMNTLDKEVAPFSFEKKNWKSTFKAFKTRALSLKGKKNFR